MQSSTPSALPHLAELIQTVRKLRAPDGCPWDRAQTHQSLRQYLIEEAYEVMDYLDQIHTTDDLKTPKIRDGFKEELGDLLMQVLLHSEMTKQEGAFDIEDVAQGLNEKLIRRHPHVFGENKAKDADAALGTWEKEKAKEKEAKINSSILEGLPKGLPALQRTARVLEKVTNVGFQWNDLKGPLGKVDEELRELKAEIAKIEGAAANPSPGATATSPSSAPKDPALRERISHELGDLLFSLCNLAYLMKVNPEDSLRSTINRFEGRFKHIERRLKEQGRKPEDSNLDEMDRYWDEAKALEKKGAK